MAHAIDVSENSTSKYAPLPRTTDAKPPAFAANTKARTRKFQKRNGIMSVLSLFLAKAEMRSVGDWSDFDPK